MPARFNHSHGCQSCGAHPDNPRNHTAKLFGCRDCKSITCPRHLAKPRACPRCNSKRLYVAVRHQADSFKNKGGIGETGKKGLFGSKGGGGGSAPDPKNKERANQAAKVATEIVKGVGAGVMEALKVLNEGNAKNNLPRPEDGITAAEKLDARHNQTHMASGLKRDMFDDIPTQKEHEKQPEIGLTNSNDPLYRLTVLAENTLDAAAFLEAPNKKPNYSTDAFIYAPNIDEAQKISAELTAHNASATQKIITILALDAHPEDPETGTQFCTLLAQNPYLFGAISINPKKAQNLNLTAADDHLTTLLNQQEKIIALGPTGFDLHFNPRGQTGQGALLSLMQELAADFQLPLILTHKQAETDITTIINNTPLHQTLILNPSQFTQLPSTANNIKYLITLDVQLEETQSTLSNIIQKIPTKQLLLASGHRNTLNKQDNNQRNTPEYTFSTLKKLQNILNKKDINSLHHTLNGNFLKTFHPDLQDEQTSTQPKI